MPGEGAQAWEFGGGGGDEINVASGAERWDPLVEKLLTVLLRGRNSIARESHGDPGTHMWARHNPYRAEPLSRVDKTTAPAHLHSRHSF